MIREILHFIAVKDPDVVTGFNPDFDLLHLRRRALALGLGTEWDWICSMNKWGQTKDLYHMPPPREKRKKFRDFWLSEKHQRIPGRNVIDLLEILLKTEKHQLAEYNLDYVGKTYLKPPLGKLTWKGLAIGHNVHKVWEEEPEVVLKYNKRDVEICVELNKQLKLIAFADEVRKLAGCQLDDIFRNKRIAHVELLRKTKKPFPVTKKEKRPYKGATVIQPKKGVYRWVIVMDFKSLYPNIIIQFNIDPDAYIPKSFRDSFKFNPLNCFVIKDPETNAEYWFRKHPEGDLPSILRNYLRRREEKKKELAKARKSKNKALIEVLDLQQYALKVIANAFYGTLLYHGNPTAFQCAKAVTLCARLAIQFAKKVIEEMGYTVIYGDTDSLMIKSKFDYEGFDERRARLNYKKVCEEAEMIRKRIKKEIPNFLKKLRAFGKSYLDLTLDKIYERFPIDEKKKRYAGIEISRFGRGKLEIKGFGSVRSDTSLFTRKLQKTLIREILYGRKKEDIKFITENMLDEYDKVPLLEIGVPCVLTKDPEKYKSNAIQVKAFKFSNTYLGTNFQVGDKPKRIYVIPDKEKASKLGVVEEVDVLAFDTNALKLPDWLRIDYPKMIEKTVKPKIEKVLKFVDLSWNEIKLKPSLVKKKKKKRKKKELPKGQQRLF